MQKMKTKKPALETLGSAGVAPREPRPRIRQPNLRKQERPKRNILGNNSSHTAEIENELHILKRTFGNEKKQDPLLAAETTERHGTTGEGIELDIERQPVVPCS